MNCLYPATESYAPSYFPIAMVDHEVLATIILLLRQRFKDNIAFTSVLIKQAMTSATPSTFMRCIHNSHHVFHHVLHPSVAVTDPVVCPGPKAKQVEASSLAELLSIISRYIHRGRKFANLDRASCEEVVRIKPEHISFGRHEHEELVVVVEVRLRETGNDDLLTLVARHAPRISILALLPSSFGPSADST